MRSRNSLESSIYEEGFTTDAAATFGISTWNHTAHTPHVECLYIEPLCQIYYYQKSGKDFIFPKRYTIFSFYYLHSEMTRTIKGVKCWWIDIISV